MNRLKLKKQVISLLQNQDLDEIFTRLSSYPEKHLVNALFSCLCHSSERVRWQAVSAFGFVVPALADKDLEEARTVMRRCLWMLNDESGGIGWGVPEALAEVMTHSPPLGKEYLHMLVSYALDDGPELFQDGNFLELEPLQQGVLWGLCRVAPVYKDELLAHQLGDNLVIYFNSSNSGVRGLCCRLAGLLGLRKYRFLIAEAQSDKGVVRWYQEGSFIDQTVAELAEAALTSLQQA